MPPELQNTVKSLKSPTKTGRNEGQKTARTNSNEKQNATGKTTVRRESKEESEITKDFYDTYTPNYNIVVDVQQLKTDYTRDFILQMHCHPRPSPKYLGNRHKQRTPWDFKLSCFKSYVPDNDSLLAKCFELDWSRTKIERMIKDEDQRDTIKHIVKKNYKWFRESYKYIAAIDP
jgi:hypothetical protein